LSRDGSERTSWTGSFADEDQRKANGVAPLVVAAVRRRTRRTPGALADQAVPHDIDHHVRRIGCPQGPRLAHQPAEIDAHRHDERLQ